MSAEDESVSPGPGDQETSSVPVGEEPQVGRGLRSRIGRPHGWGWGVPVVLVLAGALFAATALTAHGTDLRAERRTGLTDLVRSSESNVRAADARVLSLQEQVEALTAADAGDAELQAANDRADALAAPAGLTALRGPGVRVVLDDAPRVGNGDDPSMLPDGITPDDLVVHQQDVQAVVNALWAGGAEAMQLMDQRVISTSAVRCVGNTLVLQGRVYSPPFRIAAIGDPERMRQALDDAPGVKTYRQFVDVVGLGYRVETEKEITVPPYQGSLRTSRSANQGGTSDGGGE